jgi:hypothetical protein
MIAAGAAGIIWAVTGQSPSLTVTLIYSFLCGNFTLLVLENVHVPSSWRRASQSWLIHLILLIVTTPVAVTVATLLVFIFVPLALDPPAPLIFLRGFSSDSVEISGCRQFDLRRRMSFLLDDQVPLGRSEPSTAAGYQLGSVREGTRRRRAQASSRNTRGALTQGASTIDGVRGSWSVGAGAGRGR